MSKYLYTKQLFAPETNTILSTDIEPAISIDHNERLVTNISTLQRVLGITEMTPMPAGSIVKQYKYTKVNTPEQVAEGETIPLTQYKRTLANTFELKLNKYRKHTTAEAIQRVGRQKAVDDTDNLLIEEIQSDIEDAFFTTLTGAAGTAETNKGTTVQGALAAVWGRLGVYFKRKNVTSVFFVNNLDVADYLATAQVTVQSAFGFSYIENFLSLGTTIIDPSVPQGTVYGTAVQNLNGVYVPASGDVGTAFGLTADASGMVASTHYISGDDACIDTLLLSGVLFYVEDATGVVSCKITASA